MMGLYVEEVMALLSSILVGVVSIHWITKAITHRAIKAKLAVLSDRAVEQVRQTEHSCLDQPGDESVVCSATETRELFRIKQLDPVQNVINLAKRCRKYGRGIVNAITEELYDDACENAKNLDKNGADISSPIYGVPISVKESFPQKGCYSSCGLRCRMMKRCETDALIVQVLKKAGAIPLCRGNLPQLLMSMESNNNVWGRCLNPWDLSRAPGGSSGGDAALVAMRCVPIACASDVAGSCRIPASFCGIVGFKTSAGRLSLKGSSVPRLNDRNGVAMIIPAVAGPMARTVDDCAAFVKATCVPELWNNDLNLPRVPFDDKIYTDETPLKIGYFKTDNWFEPCSAMQRGIDTTVDALKKAGHTLIPFELPVKGWETNRLLLGVNAAEGNMRSYKAALEGEDFIDEFKFLYTVANVPELVRSILKRVVDKRRAFLLNCSKSGGLKVHEFLELTQDILDFRTKWSEAFVASGIDAVIYPAMPIPAVPHGLSQKLSAASATYMFIANLLLWPCGSVPVTLVKEDEQDYRDEKLPNDQRDLMASVTRQVMENSAGMPLSVNVMTPALQDEKCLRAMKEVERAVCFEHEPTAYKNV